MLKQADSRLKQRGLGLYRTGRLGVFTRLGALLVSLFGSTQSHGLQSNKYLQAIFYRHYYKDDDELITSIIIRNSFWPRAGNYQGEKQSRGASKPTEVIAEMRDIALEKCDTESDEAFEELKEVLTQPVKAESDWLPDWGRHVWSSDYQEEYKAKRNKIE